MNFQSRDLIAVLLAMAFGLVVAALTFHAVPQENRELFSAMAGSLGTLLGLVVKFYFPSDQGSEAKTATIADQAKALAGNSQQGQQP